MMKKIFCAIVLMAGAFTANAQSGTNSPYSQYGLGILSNQSAGFSRGMDGLGIGYRDGKQVNFLNPSSYSGIDSLTFIFDGGVAGQITNFSENGVKKNAKNANFEYVVAGFRLQKHVGVGVGIVPFTNVGYNYVSEGYLNEGRTASYKNTYEGKGGFRQAFFGVGWEPLRNVSVGVNFSYLWGSYEKSIANVYNDVWVNTLYKYYNASVSSYKLDAGLQYTLPLGKKDKVTLGVTYSPKHKLGAEPECLVVSTNTTTNRNDTATFVSGYGLEIPEMMGAGLMYHHDNRLKLGIDYSLQKWAGVGFPELKSQNGQTQYVQNMNYFKDRHKVTFGGEYCKGSMMRGFFNRLRYRAGVSYATSYLNVKGQDGPKELSVSAGLGIPIINVYNNRSLLNISGQWIRQSGNHLLTENSFRINIGITFNELWFMKWKMK